MNVNVMDLKRGDHINISSSREVRVERVERVEPETTAGLEHDDSLHGSGQPFARVHYTRREPGDPKPLSSYKDYPLSQQLSVWWSD